MRKVVVYDVREPYWREWQDVEQEEDSRLATQHRLHNVLTYSSYSLRVKVFEVYFRSSQLYSLTEQQN
mgnify:CR=1 FL=1